MGSPDVGAEVMARLGNDDRKKAEQAIRSVRKRLTMPFKVEEDMGVLESQRPRHIARLLAGHMDAWVDLHELMWAREHFVELGRKIGPFYNDFVEAREAAKRGKKRYIPTEPELRAAFGEDWMVVRDAWPAVPFLAQVLALQATPSMSEDEKTAREEACWIEAEAFLAVLHPNKVEEGDFIDFVRRKVSKLRKMTDDRPGLVNEVLKHVFAEPAGLRERLLVYKPRGTVNAVLRYWTRAFKNAARDAVEPRMLGVMDDQPVMRDSSTLRRWKLEDKKRVQTGEPPRHSNLLDRALENNDRLKHHDPTGTRLTLTQVADQLGRPESVVRNAVKRARAAGELVPERMPNGRDYAFRRDVDDKIIERFLGARRGMRTVGAAAREAGVPVERAVDLIQHLAAGMGLDRERVLSPKKTIPAEVYEILVDKLRENVPAVAATGGSAKPRTS
jgi:hypothetical protein